MLVLVLKRMERLNLFGICLVSFHRLLLRTVHSCLGLATMKNITTIKPIMLDTIYQKSTPDKLISGSLLIMPKYMSFIFHLNTLTKKAVNNTISCNKI